MQTAKQVLVAQWAALTLQQQCTLVRQGAAMVANGPWLTNVALGNLGRAFTAIAWHMRTPAASRMAGPKFTATGVQYAPTVAMRKVA